MSNLNDRNTYIAFDALSGNDPLSDKLNGKLATIPKSATYMIQKQNEFRSDKIATKFLGDAALYWVILEYNNLSSNYDLVSGLLLNIPDARYLNSLMLGSTKTIKTSTIYIK